MGTGTTDLPADAVERACAGDRAALEQVLVSLQRPFYNLALRMLGERALAEDAAQECLIRVMTHLSEYRGEAKFTTWATRIAVNAVLDWKGGMAREARYAYAFFLERLVDGRDALAEERPEDALLLKQCKTQCSRALLQCLDGDMRMAYVLGEILELDSSEAAEILAIDPAAFRKRLSRARAELTAFLARECSVHTAGRACACHRKLDHLTRSGRIDAAQLEVRVGDLKALRTRLVVLDAEARTDAIYQSDERPNLRAGVLDSVREVLSKVASFSHS